MRWQRWSHLSQHPTCLNCIKESLKGNSQEFLHRTHKISTMSSNACYVWIQLIGQLVPKFWNSNRFRSIFLRPWNNKWGRHYLCQYPKLKCLAQSVSLLVSLEELRISFRSLPTIGVLCLVGKARPIKKTKWWEGIKAYHQYPLIQKIDRVNVWINSKNRKKTHNHTWQSMKKLRKENNREH